MQGNEIEKTFVERSPASLMSSSQFPLNGGMRMVMPGTRPIVGQTRLGSCLVTDVIGEGGMAIVYKAWNERLEVFRAIKLLLQESFYARFETEAKIIAKLHHESIVEVHNVAEWNGMPYMEMEYVDGSDLQQMLAERGRLPESVCLAIAISVAEALSHAHTQTFTLIGNQYSGIIHRDLKPANIMLSKNGAVKLTDFGIARPTEASIHTVENNIVGTLQYLSPEQMEGVDVDNRSDIYSFGAILYEMVTGVKTFPYESTTEIIKYKSVNKFKMPQEHGISISPELVKIICRCLKRAPDKRYQSAHELVEDLRKLYMSMTTLPPKDIVRNYLEGKEDITQNLVKPKTRWIFGKPKTEPSAVPKKTKTLDISKIQLTVDKPKTDVSTKTNGANVIDAPQNQYVETVPPVDNNDLPSADNKMMELIDNDTMDLTERTNFKRNTLISVSIALLAFTIPPAIMKITALSKSPKVETTAMVTVEQDSLESLQTKAADSSITKTTVKGTPIAPSVPAKVKVAPTQTAPAAIDTAIETQNFLEAIAAVNAKQWDRAIELFEQDSIYKTRNKFRTLQLFNAYVESRNFDKAQSMMDTASIAQDAYFLFCTGKYWRYRGFANQAVAAFEASLSSTSIMSTKGVIPEAALYYIAEIKHERYQKNPTDDNKTIAVDGWRKAHAVLSNPKGTMYKRAEREIAALSGE